MSLTLGPIHTWLFKKINFQNELTDMIIERIEKKGYYENLIAFLDKRYGVVEEGNLADLIDGDNIHGWLQERVSRVENRLAAAVSLTLEEHPESLVDIIAQANAFGKCHKITEKMNLRETFNYLDSILLNGMPCDHVNKITSEDEELITWEQTTEIHGKYWDMVKGDVVNYYDIRNAVIEGLLEDTDVKYAENAENKYELRGYSVAMEVNMITKEMTIGEIISVKEDAAAILMNNGMHCIGCPSSQMESLEEACMVHGMDVEKVLEQLNK